MGDAIFANQPFRINPDQVRWSYQPKVAVINTRGGKVIQVYGVELGDMTVSGQFGVVGWQGQAEFLERMRQISDRQAEEDRMNPLRFLFPEKGWDFQVYLKGFTSADGPQSVELSPEIINPTWTLTLFLVEDNLNLKKVATDAFIERLAEGIGWTINEFNGPVSDEDLTIRDRGLAAMGIPQ